MQDLIAGRPSGTLITSLKHRISFLYFEYARVVKSDNSLMAITGDLECDIPAANLSVLMLGPGTSITHDALMELSRWNCSVMATSGNGLGLYSSMNASASTSAKIVLRQAEIVSSDALRLEAARRMYGIRWGDSHVPEETTLRGLMAMEGRRMRQVYRECAQSAGVSEYRRVQKVDFSGEDVVNQLVTSGNAMIYGIVNAVCVGIGASPALGVIHHGHSRAFVFDIADFYKEDMVIPLAFQLYAEGKDARSMRTALRQKGHGLKLIPDIIEKIYSSLSLGDDSDEDIQDILALWTTENILYNDGNAVTLGRS